MITLLITLIIIGIVIAIAVSIGGVLLYAIFAILILWVVVKIIEWIITLFSGRSGS